MTRPDAPVRSLRALAYKVPTDRPEADGTFAWDATTLVVVHAEGGGRTGIGYTYADASNVPPVRLRPSGRFASHTIAPATM